MGSGHSGLSPSYPLNVVVLVSGSSVDHTCVLPSASPNARYDPEEEMAAAVRKEVTSSCKDESRARRRVDKREGGDGRMSGSSD